MSSPSRFICHLSKSLNMIGCRGDIKGRFFEKKIFSETIRGIKLKLGMLHA